MKSSWNQILFSIMVLLTWINFSHLYANKVNSTDTCEILLIGSSYFNFNNQAAIIKNLADHSGTEIYIEMFGQNGLYLADHANSSATEAKISERNWDYVVMQGVGVLVAYPEYFTHHPVYPALETLHSKIKENCEDTHIMFCMPWAFEDGMTWYDDWTDTYEDMQIHIYNNTLLYADDIGFEIAPVGWVWYAVLEEYDYPLHYLHMSDWNHPSFKGSYLMACTIFSAVFQESTVGNSYYDGIPEDEAVFFQSVASDSVLNSLELWNITPLVMVPEVNDESLFIHLNQNFPNPVTAKTNIRYTVTETVQVTIRVYDVLGNLIETLVNDIHQPGDYEIELEVSRYKKGYYFCRIQSKNDNKSIKMIVQ